MIEFNTVLVLSPHPDDAELGAGGTIAKLLDEGKDIHYVAFSSCEKSVPEGLPKNILLTECKNSTSKLGISGENLILLDYEVRTFPEHRQDILEKLIELNEKIKPDLVFIPSSNDIHQDHQVIHNEALRAFKKNASIFGYEHPWNNLSFTTDVFISLTDAQLDRKIKSLSQYQSQDFRVYFSEEYIRALAYTRGIQANFRLAETFELLRLLS